MTDTATFFSALKQAPHVGERYTTRKKPTQ